MLQGATEDRIRIRVEIHGGGTEGTMLTLPIKGLWYDMIRSGAKKEEYRERTRYWQTRLHTLFGTPSIYTAMYAKTKATVLFRNGYGAARPTIRATVTLRIGTGRPEWGAEPEKEYYVLCIEDCTEVN